MPKEFAWSAERPSRGYPNAQRDPKYTNAAETNEEDFQPPKTHDGDDGTDIEGIDTTPGLLDGILGDPFVRPLADSFLDMSGGGLTFRLQRPGLAVSLERRSTHTRHRQRWRTRHCWLGHGEARRIRR